MNDKLTTVDKETAIEVQPPVSGELSVERAFQAILSGQIDAGKLAVLKDLLAMNAEMKFNAAFVALQAKIPVITAKTAVKNRGKYEKFEDIMAVVGPILTEHGFTVSFSQDCKDSRILEICTLSHSAGHSRNNSFAVRAGTGDNNTQIDCKAATTAKRNALCNALNIVIRQDCLNNEDDAGLEGDPNEFVSAKVADELEVRANAVNSNIPAFLAFAKAKTFATIPANRYADLDQMLRRKETAGK